MTDYSIYTNKELTKIYWLSNEEFAGESIFLAEQELIRRGIFTGD